MLGTGSGHLAVDVRSLAKKSLGLCSDLTHVLNGTFDIRKHLRILKVLALQIITCNLLAK